MTEPASEAPRRFDAVVFDFGGVVISPLTNKITKLANERGIDYVDLLEVLIGSMVESTDHHPWHRAERGEVAIDEMQALLAPYAEARGIALDGSEIALLFEADYTFNQQVLDRIAGLRKEGYLVGLLTNSVREFRPILESQVDFGLFDVVVDSSEEGARKPDRAIYESTSARLGVDPDRIVFLDDFEPNIVGARAAGWTAIKVLDPDEALADLDAALAVPR